MCDIVNDVATQFEEWGLFDIPVLFNLLWGLVLALYGLFGCI